MNFFKITHAQLKLILHENNLTEYRQGFIQNRGGEANNRFANRERSADQEPNSIWTRQYSYSECGCDPKMC